LNSLFGELLPEWIDPELWAAFIEMRKCKGKHAPLTETGKKLLIIKLGRLRSQGHPPNEVIAESVMNGWSGFHPIDKRQLTPTVVSGSQPIYKHQEVKQSPEAVNQGLEGLREARKRMMASKVK
jgi:hypothetical protein